MRIIIDTNVLWDLPALDRLGDSEEVLVLPAVAFAERARQLVASGRGLSALFTIIEETGLLVEPFGRDEALRGPAQVRDPDVWKRHSRDALIAGHVGPDDQLWTRNVEDFVQVGVPRAQIVAI